MTSNPEEPCLQVQMLGGAKLLTSEQVEDIYEIRRKSGMAGRHPALFPEK